VSRDRLAQDGAGAGSPWTRGLSARVCADTMIELRDKVTNEPLGTISDDELRFLVDELEEESPTDRDYYISSDTVDMLEADGAPSSLLTLLKRILGSEEGIEVRWIRVWRPWVPTALEETPPMRPLEFIRQLIA